MNDGVDYQSILDFWFGVTSSDIEILEQQSSLWWTKDPNVDKEIEIRFGASLDSLIAGQLNKWKQLPESYLAMIILADQFSRNIYRDTERAFAQDELALALTLEGIDAGIDMKLGLVQRVFFYLPLEHSESISMQYKSVEQYRQLHDVAPDNIRKKFKDHLDYAIQHREIIEKFGRYPHRNVILGRQSTIEEIEFLKQPGSSF
jgi:uncharacterized protein (DUF924 family)